MYSAEIRTKGLFFPQISAQAQTKPALSLLEWFTSTQRHLRLNEVWGGPLRKHSRQVPTKRGLRPPAPVGLASRARKSLPCALDSRPQEPGCPPCVDPNPVVARVLWVSRTDGVDGWLAGWLVASAWRCRDGPLSRLPWPTDQAVDGMEPRVYLACALALTRIWSLTVASRQAGGTCSP